jgi:hypothetical protein
MLLVIEEVPSMMMMILLEVVDGLGWLLLVL